MNYNALKDKTNYGKLPAKYVLVSNWGGLPRYDLYKMSKGTTYRLNLTNRTVECDLSMIDSFHDKEVFQIEIDWSLKYITITAENFLLYDTET